MAYDEQLAERVRIHLEPRVAFTERAMFGGLAFMVNTHMACGLMSQGLMVRVGKPDYDAALARGAQEMLFTGRPMRGMVLVPDALVADDDGLESWVGSGVAFALSEAPKKPKKR
jgi:TfoX/Sxy family transcriptional regulator of competence genes